MKSAQRYLGRGPTPQGDQGGDANHVGEPDRGGCQRQDPERPWEAQLLTIQPEVDGEEAPEESDPLIAGTRRGDVDMELPRADDEVVRLADRVAHQRFEQAAGGPKSPAAQRDPQAVGQFRCGPGQHADSDSAQEKEDRLAQQGRPAMGRQHGRRPQPQCQAGQQKPRHHPRLGPEQRLRLRSRRKGRQQGEDGEGGEVAGQKGPDAPGMARRRPISIGCPQPRPEEKGRHADDDGEAGEGRDQGGHRCLPGNLCR